VPTQSSVTPAQVAQIVELRKQKKPDGKPCHTFREIGDQVGVTKSQAEYVYYRSRGRPSKEKPVLAIVEEVPLIMINGGVMWTQPVKAPQGRHKKYGCQSNCDFCPLRDRCDEAMARCRGDFIGCEAPLVREMA